MAIYDNGTASLAANGQVTGIGTQWTMPLTLIRVGATLVFKTEPVQIYTISEITSDTSMSVYNPNGETVPAGTGYAILAHDGITVQGLAQDVAETLRYYQSKETSIESLLQFIGQDTFDWPRFEQLATQSTTAAAEALASQIASAESASTAVDARNTTTAARDDTIQAINSAGDAGTLVTLSGWGIGNQSVQLGSLDFQTFDFVVGGSYRVALSNVLNVPPELVFPTGSSLLIGVESGSGSASRTMTITSYTSSNSAFRRYVVTYGVSGSSRSFFVREQLLVPGGNKVGGADAARVRGLLDVYSKNETFQKSLNFSDVANKSVARTNLDVYSKDESNDLLNYKYGYPTSSPAGAVQRKVHEKLNDFAFLEDFGGKADNGTTDNGPAFVAAFAAGVTNIKLGSSGVYAIASGNIELPERFNITGKGDGCEIKYLGNDSGFTMFTFRGTQGASNWKNGGTFSDVVISSESQVMTWFIGEYIQNVNLERVVLYNARTIVNDFHYMNFNTCRLIASGFTGRANLPGSAVSESPKFIGCFASNSPIDIKDTADLAIIGSTMFAGEYIVQTGTERDNITSPDLRKGFPVLFSNSVFDAGLGSAWRLENVAYASISGCFVSCGRTNNSDGAYLNKVYDSSISNCIFNYCGRYGLAVERSAKVSIVGCNFNGNKDGGLALINSENINVVGGSAGTSYIQGGYYVQPIGITSPADDCTNVVVTGFNFGSELATKYYFGTDAARGNRVVSCTGVLDSVFRGGSSDRPSGASYGQQFFDTSLGQPIWWNSISSTWKNALGEDV